MGLTLWVEPGDGMAVPGGMATFTLRVANQGPIVDRIRVGFRRCPAAGG